ncbi:hypothetical protein HII17_18450 [Thalassotalea sp. M1531]|uniref:Uncharacterized protein n=1 Tax=Thalassotalea algicola TaxID=2716224 RepID=A0A7Y0LFY2_9GAMM|nr:hypothetical protein [Thalassotalea algicola]NMP33532.1 hypothetical protein [Thalassotalea algicola]
MMTMSDEQLQHRVAQLNKEISPSRDLWQGIEKAIHQQDEQSSSVKKAVVPMAWAASVVAAVLLTWMNLGPANNGNQELGLIAAINQDFNAQKQLMLTSFGTPDLTQLPADMQAELAKLAKARTSIAAALENDENNTDLIELLQWTQQQELDLIKRLYTPQWQTI